MSEANAPRFTCGGCGKSYSWKQELAGKRVKCKCGHVMTVAESMPDPQGDDDGLYDFAPADEPVKTVASPRVPLAPLAPRASTATQSLRPPTVQAATATAIPAALGYQTGPTQKQKDRFSTAALMDMNRDVYVPVGLLVFGLASYVAYYAIKYELGGVGIAATGAGLGIITAMKAALLVGFALVVAAPLGVSFGGIWTATLKLAAIAVFSDGVTTWVDAGVASMSGGAGGAFAGMISFPVSLGIYWVLLIKLFSMDPGDSWMVVVILSVFDFIVRWVLMLLLLQLVLSWGGSSIAASVPSIGGGSSAADPMVQRIEQMKDLNQLEEAKQYIVDGHQASLGPSVDALYAAGCKKVWFEVSRDINGRGTPSALLVELPKAKDKAARAKCYDTLKQYFDSQGMAYNSANLTDTGERYLEVGIR